MKLQTTQLHHFMKNIIFLILFSCISLSGIHAQSGFKLRVKIKGAEDKFMILAHYYGEKQYIDDTLRLTKQGWYTLNIDSILPGGLYIIAGDNKNRYFEFLMDGEKNIDFETSAQEAIKDMVVKGSPNNTIFFNYVAYLSSMQKSMEALQKEFTSAKGNTVDEERIRKNIEELNESVLLKIQEYIHTHKGSFVSDFIRSSQEIQIPANPVLPNGKTDSTFAYKYYKAHFFDNMEPGDARLLRTPIYHTKLNQYFSKMLIQHPDTIIKETRRLLPSFEKTPETLRYFIWYLLNYTERSQIMGMDAAFVYISENFYENGRMDYWINATVRDNIVKKAKKLKPNLIGAIAPELIMLDTAMRPVSLHHVKARYTIVFFWDPECGHCRKEIPLMVDFYNQNKESLNLEVFAVCSDTNMMEMKKYIIKNKMNWINVNGPRTYVTNYRDLYDVYSTPVIYLLDENKKIIAKRLLTEQLQGFISRKEDNKAEQIMGILPH